MEEIPAQDQQLPKVKMDVKTALIKQDQAHCGEYDALLNIFMDTNTETRVLRRCLSQLRNCVTLVSKEHERLVGIILNMDWLSGDFAFTSEFMRFILNLVSAHPYYLRSCIRMLVKRFLPQASKRTESGNEKGPDKTTREHYQNTFKHVHDLLKAVAGIVPSTKKELMPVMRDCFPYITRDVYCFEAYTHNLLMVVQYIPDLRQEVLKLLVEKMLQLDVRAPRNEIVEAEDDEEEEEEEKEEEDDGEMFQMDGIEEGKEEKAKTPEEDGISQGMNHREAERLDAMMDLMLNYIHSTCYPKDVFDWEAAKKLYRELLAVFDTLILSTHASCHSQFLMFYIVSFRRELLVGFLDFLWKKVKAPMMQNVFRQAAAGYIGSLLARGAFVHSSTLTTTVKLMTDWLHNYLHEMGNDVLHADLAHHAPFYAVCQAVFYVICFSNEQILKNDKAYKWADSLGLQRLVNCKLNPLRLCLPLVCTTFASITRMHQLALCDTVIQRNERFKCGLSENTLEAYFPFDPYLLKRSRRWIKGLYRKYEGVLQEPKKTSDDMEEDDDDDFIPDEDLDVSLGASAFSTSADKLDFMKYSVSPGFKQ